ncbi:STAS domain-containing protein [Micromonospora sp. WMMA1363]|uniref:STAS domain-containing protein n=1 Tax=Micromonospora sp. WMMA1363 TaxID=3053985 RepID=UPI00259C8B47|nr:STAS domain-containing protein [Micromonospora sp. WMMA1363]MDM4719271.1 STAS domain-containing protein [Micromonospora sp. WMMA1363]
MTVVPDENTMTLICDGCGDTAASTAVVLPDAEVVWTLVSEHGWSGSPFATGPHRCPRCTPLPAPGEAAAGTHPLGAEDLEEIGDPVPAAAEPDTGALQAALAAVEEHDGRVTVDLSAVEQIDSVGLGLLVRARQEARQRGAVLCLRAPSRFVLTVLHTMRLETAFPVVAARSGTASEPEVLV